MDVEARAEDFLNQIIHTRFRTIECSGMTFHKNKALYTMNHKVQATKFPMLQFSAPTYMKSLKFLSQSIKSAHFIEHLGIQFTKILRFVS